MLTLQAEEFDALYCLDKDPEALALAMLAKADEKRGFAMSPAGTPTIFNDGALYALQLALSDPLKFYYNEKIYQKIIFEACDLKYDGEEYVLDATPYAKKHAIEKARNIRLIPDTTIVGINTGCGGVFKTKQWTIDGFCELIERLSKCEKPVQCVLLGGEREREFNAEIFRRMTLLVKPNESRKYPFLVISGCDNTLEEFVGVVDLCDVVLSSDSLAMHLAIGLKKKTIVFFGPTCHQEIELYGRGEKIVTDFDCAPCYLHTCDKSPTCMQALSGESVFKVVEKFL
jgi:heptosyltransferase-2